MEYGAWHLLSRSFSILAKLAHLYAIHGFIVEIGLPLGKRAFLRQTLDVETPTTIPTAPTQHSAL